MNPDDQKNAVALWMDFTQRCNYGATFQGVALNHILMKKMYELNFLPKEFKDVIYSMVIAGELFNNFLDDMVGGYQIAMGLI